MPEAMVVGEKITPEEANSPGWITAHKKRPASPLQATGKQHCAPAGAKYAGALKKVAAASRLPSLPADQCRVVIRPGGGLDVRKSNKLKVLQSLLLAARLPPTAADEDIVCTNDTQNIFVISTPSTVNAEAYANVREIVLMEQRHPVSAYVAAPGNTSRGVVRGVDADLPDCELQRLFLTPHNPMLLGVRRIKDTTTVILLFNGLKVPNYVRCGMLLLRCTLYKRQIDTCRVCGRVGHRQDVCPTPTEKVCEHCGAQLTGSDHKCVQPKCALCGQGHVTGDRTCPNRYQVPYVVRRRRRRRRRRNSQPTQGSPASYKQQQTTPTPKQQAQTQPSTSKTTTQATWADRVTNKGETRGPEQSRQLPQHVNDKIQTLERENALLRKELTEIKTLLRNTQQQRERAVSEPAPAATATPAALSTPSNAAAASRAAKRRAAEDIEDEPLTIANLNRLLEQFRAAIIAEITPIKLQLTEHSARLEMLEAGRQTAPQIAPSPMQQ